MEIFRRNACLYVSCLCHNEDPKLAKTNEPVFLKFTQYLYFKPRKVMKNVTNKSPIFLNIKIVVEVLEVV